MPVNRPYFCIGGFGDDVERRKHTLHFHDVLIGDQRAHAGLPLVQLVDAPFNAPARVLILQVITKFAENAFVLLVIDSGLYLREDPITP